MKKKKQDYEDAYDYEDTDYDAAYDEDYDGDYEAYDDYEDYDNLDNYEGYDEEEAPRKLTLKEKIRIVSRRDMMGRALPTWYRILIAVVVLAGLTLGLNFMTRNAYAGKAVTGAPVDNNQVQLSFVGDVCLGGDVGTYGEASGYSGLFAQASQLWRDSSLVFANLECTVIRQNTAYYDHPKEVKYAASQTALKVAAEKGVNAVSVANDHVGDYGWKGIEHTLLALDKYGVSYAGAGENITAAGSYQILQAGNMKVGFVSFTDVVPKHFAAGEDHYGVVTSNYPELYAQVNGAAQNADLVVVYVHWGDIDGLNVTERQEQLAHQLIDSGADVVIGCHPKVLQKTEFYGNGVIFYSLGSFIADGMTRTEQNSAMVQLNIDKTTGVREFTVIPLHLYEYAPAVATRSLYTREIDRTLTDGLDKSRYQKDAQGWITFQLAAVQKDLPEMTSEFEEDDS